MRKNTPGTVAAMTGGEYEMFATRKNFEARMVDFTNHLHSRYLLSIEPEESPCGVAPDSGAAAGAGRQDSAREEQVLGGGGGRVSDAPCPLVPKETEYRVSNTEYRVPSKYKCNGKNQGKGKINSNGQDRPLYASFLRKPSTRPLL